MGWCSATDIFDDMCRFVLPSGQPEAEKVKVLARLVETLEQNDWDCQRDSAYFDDPIVQCVMRDIHPRWFEDEEKT